MGPKELAVRTGQAIAKRWDFIAGGQVLRWVGKGNPCWSQETGRFFFNAGDVPEILDCLRERLPEIVDDTVQRAERICRHRFDLLGYEDIDYGPEIDWSLDAVHAKRAPRRPWYKVPYLDFDQVGDHKVTWELNRHHHLVTLAKAYRITGEERYARELFTQWYHWQRENPCGIGINWASSLEVAFRSVSWLWIRYLLDGCSIVPEQFPMDLSRAMMMNGRHIERFLSTYFSPNTHLLGEGVALFFIGTLCPGLPPAQRWRARGWKIVLNQAHLQVLPDGMHFEQSIYYHVYALDFFIHSRVLAALNGLSVPVALDRIIERMLEVVRALCAAGPLPQLGDDDGGRVFDPRRNRMEHLVDPLASGAVLFKRGDFKAAAGDIREETVWLLGAEGVKQFDGIPIQQRPAKSFALKASGLYVMSNSQPVSQRLAIDAGPHGAARAGHAHAGALSLQLAVNGRELLIDPGTLAYADSTGERDRFRATSAHNTVVVDDANQAEPVGPFGWQFVPNVRIHHWTSGNNFDLFVGSHDGYSRLPHGIQHRRHVVHAKPYFWLVRDVLEGEGMHRLDAHWHFAPGELLPMPGGFTFFSNQQAALTLLFLASHSWIHEIRQGWRSPVYGRKEPCPVLCIGTDATLPVEFATVLAPVSQTNTCTGLLCSPEVTSKKPPVRAYQYSSAEVISYLFFAEQATSWQVGEWESDAQFVFCSKAVRDNRSHFAISRGSYVKVRGRRLFAAPEAVPWSEWCSDDVGSFYLDERVVKGEAFWSTQETATHSV
jgi:hypothetical protein